MANNPNELQDFESYTEEDQVSYGESNISITAPPNGENLQFEEEVVITRVTE